MAENSAKQDISHRISHNNLHIKCTAFEQQEANTVLGLMQKFHKNCQRIFIDVRDIAKPGRSVAQSFKNALSTCAIAPQQVIFKGSGGFDLAINGNRVLVKAPAEKTKAKPKGHVCCGRCKNCHCHDHEHD
ncbi:MAG: squalene cyclase [Desulfovibrio sp.]|nr:squalene cyclase [Desulfovibrio sp.]